MNSDKVTEQIVKGSLKAHKTYVFDEQHNYRLPAEMWFQQSNEGAILFVVFYSQACRWSRCLGCNLPSKVSKNHVTYDQLMAQIDHVLADPAVVQRFDEIRKVIVSNNGSILDEATFSSTALIYLIAKLNLHLPKLATLCIETRPEYVDLAELEFLSRALAEGIEPTQLEIAVGFEAFDDHIRNDVFDKGLTRKTFESFVARTAPYGFRIKCYFMQKPVPGMTDQQAVDDIHQAIDYLSEISRRYQVQINMHLNPTYVASGTELENAFRENRYSPPRLRDVVTAIKRAEGKPISIFIGLSDEGLAVEGGSFLREEDAPLAEKLQIFNRSQDFRVFDQ